MVADVEVEDVDRVTPCGIAVESGCEGNRIRRVGSLGCQRLAQTNERG